LPFSDTSGFPARRGGSNVGTVVVVVVVVGTGVSGSGSGRTNWPRLIITVRPLRRSRTYTASVSPFDSSSSRV